MDLVSATPIHPSNVGQRTVTVHAVWEIGTSYLLNVSMDPTVENNRSAATFKFTIENTKSKQLIEVGKIQTTNPSGTHGIPADKYRCDQVISLSP